MPTDAATLKRVRPKESSSSINSTVFTLDPKHKYLTPRPLTCKPVLTDDCASARKDISVQVCAQLLGMVRYGANRANKSSQELPQAVSTPLGEANKERTRTPGLSFRQSSLMAVFHRMRGTKSAEYRRESNTANSFLHRGKVPGSTSATLKKSKRSTKSADDLRSTSHNTPSRATTAAVLGRNPLPPGQIMSQKVLPDSYVYTTQPTPTPAKLNMAPPNTPIPSEYERSGSGMCSPSQAEATRPSFSSSIPESDIVPSDSRIHQTSNERKPSISTESDPHTRNPETMEQTLPIAGEYTRHSSLDELRDGIYSPGLRVNSIRSGSSSPCHLSEPESPLSPDLDQHQIPIKDGSFTDGTPEDHDTPWHMRTMAGGRYDDTRPLDKPSPQPFFAGYSLPQSEHASALTIKQPQLNPFQNYNSNPFHNSNDRNGIEIKDSSPTLRMTALEELVEDLGYMGQAII